MYLKSESKHPDVFEISLYFNNHNIFKQETNLNIKLYLYLVYIIVIFIV